MSYGGEFAGSIVVGGTLRSNSVSVFLDDVNLSLRELDKNRLSRLGIVLLPFNKHMILTQSARSMKEGLFFDIKGNNVGVISEGPRGHPGDGEYDARNIIAYRAVVTYFIDHIKVELDGTSTSGVDALDTSKALLSTTFSANFDIPKDRLTEFFRLNDAASANVLKAFDQAFA